MEGKSAKRMIGTILSRLRRRYREEMRTSLAHVDEWELLVATMLSAQSQDAQVNKVTPALFKRYPNVKSYGRLRPSDLYPYAKTLGLYRGKAKNIVNAARMINLEYGGRVPHTLNELVALPGVGRKTANVVLSNGFGIHEGIAIDTHCITVANRLFLFRTKSAEVIEHRMMGFVPRRDWGNVTNLFIALGRDVCTARAKLCDGCVLNDICPSSTVARGGK